MCDDVIVVLEDPVENVWQFMRQNWLSNRVFKNAARQSR